MGCGPAEERVLLTGLHAVADIYCENCKTTLGWKYVSPLSLRHIVEQQRGFSGCQDGKYHDVTGQRSKLTSINAALFNAMLTLLFRFVRLNTFVVSQHTT